MSAPVQIDGPYRARRWRHARRLVLRALAALAALALAALVLGLPALAIYATAQDDTPHSVHTRAHPPIPPAWS